MTIDRARALLGDRSAWELRNMRKALSMMPFMNTDEENERLEAVKTLLRAK